MPCGGSTVCAPHAVYYFLAYEGYANGEPMMASMHLSYPEDKSAYRTPRQYRFAKAFLCAPVTSPMEQNAKAAQKIWLPDGIYHHFAFQ